MRFFAGLLVFQSGYAGERLAFHIFQESASSRGNMGDPVVDPRGFNDSPGITAPDNAGGILFGQELRYRNGAFVKGLLFSNSQWAVPYARTSTFLSTTFMSFTVIFMCFSSMPCFSS